MNKKVVFGLMMNCISVGFPLAIFSDDSKTTALYPCADLLFQNVWTIDNPEDQRHGRRYDGRRLESDLFFILDGERNELYLYTPYFSGKADLKIDKNGRPIQILNRPKPRDPKKEKEMLDLIQQASKNSGFKDVPSVKFLDSDDKSPGTPQYNIRVPYWPNGKNGGGAGFYYFTINDVPWGGHHDSRINMPPRFLSGPAESKPNFKREKPKGSIQIIQDDETAVEFHSLEIEDALWNTRTAANFSTEARELLLRDMVARMGSLEESMDRQIATTIRGDRFGGIPPSREDLTISAQKNYSQVLDVCREAAKSTGENSLITQLDRQPARIGQSEEDKATHEKWQSQQKGDPIVLSIYKIRGHYAASKVYPMMAEGKKVLKGCDFDRVESMWHLAKVDLKINPNGSVDPTTLKVYAINTSTPGGCLNLLSKFLSQIRFPETSGESVWIQASYGSYPKK